MGDGDLLRGLGGERRRYKDVDEDDGEGRRLSSKRSCCSCAGERDLDRLRFEGVERRRWFGGILEDGGARWGSVDAILD